MNRRTFVRTAGWTALSYSAIAGASDRVRIGMIGIGIQGTVNLGNFLNDPGAEVVALCDVDRNHLDAAKAKAGSQARVYQDFRQLLDQADIDAVVVSTPDHWHALNTIMACQAGKDVYVEKPLALTIEEGQRMVAAARHYRRVVQVGTQQRSGAHFQRAVEVVHSGALGKVTEITFSKLGNSMPSWGDYPDSPPPPELDWDMWLGPVPYQQYNALRCHYNFRWFWATGGGQMTNWGPHHLDTARWMLNERGATQVMAMGRRLALTDIGETPDVQEALFDFRNTIVRFTIRDVNSGGTPGLKFHGPHLQVHGTYGTMTLCREGFYIEPEYWGTSNLRRGRPSGEKPGKKSEAMEMLAGQMEQPHVRNFIECIRSRERPAADVEEGHLSATLCHLGNISTRLRKAISWDPSKEEFVGDAEASAMLSRPYRAPWRLPEFGGSA